MIDCDPGQLMEGDLPHRLPALLPQIGRIQRAAVPDHGAPKRPPLGWSPDPKAGGPSRFRPAASNRRPGHPASAGLSRATWVPSGRPTGAPSSITVWPRSRVRTGQPVTSKPSQGV